MRRAACDQRRCSVGLGLVVALVAAVALAAGGGAQELDPDVDAAVRLNQTQVVGSHNSYHQIATPAERDLRRQFIGDAEDELEYDHAPLPTQFESQKVRQIELDVFADEDGGLYADPLIREATDGGPYDPVMEEPGAKVLHIQDVDYHSNCLTLVACLSQVEGWSDAHPTHLPIAILVELKDSPVPDIGGFSFVQPEPFDTAAIEAIDDEIRSVMGPEDLITPDDVRDGASTLNEAVLDDGWPTLADARGQVMVLMDNGAPYRERYRTGAPSLEGRVMFTNADPGDDDAAFIKRNDAFDPSIPDLVEEGYLVRTRADAGTTEARTGDTAKRDAALASGAQWVSTDYPVPDYGQGFETDYVTEIPGGTVARCNPVNAPPECVDSLLGDVSAPAPEPPEPEPEPDTPEPPGTAPPSSAVPAEPVTGAPDFTG